MKTRMLRLMGVAICILLLTGTVVPVGAAENLVVNGNLQSSAGFTLSGDASLSTGTGPDGVNALVLAGEGENAVFYVEGLTANKTYGFSAMVKSNQDGAAAITVQALQKNQDSTYTELDETYASASMQHYSHATGTDTYVSTGNAWRFLQFNFTLPGVANTAKITLSCTAAEQTVSFADLSVYPAANLISNGDFEGVSVYEANPTTATNNTGITFSTTGTAGNWRYKKADATKNTMIRNPLSTWGASHFTYAEDANPLGYAYTEAGAAGYGISQVVPVQTGRMYHLSADWGVWHTDGAPIMQLWTNTAGTSFTKQWVYDREGGDKTTKKWIHTDYYFFVSAGAAVADDMTEICLYWNDNSGKGRTVLDNVLLEAVNTTYTTKFSEGYAELSGMPEGGNATVTVKNTYRIPADASNDGTERTYKTMVGLYKLRNGVPMLENINLRTSTLVASTSSDSIATVSLDILVPTETAGEQYKIVSYTWDEGMSPHIEQTVLAHAE